MLAALGPHLALPHSTMNETKAREEVLSAWAAGARKLRGCNLAVEVLQRAEKSAAVAESPAVAMPRARLWCRGRREARESLTVSWCRKAMA